MDNKQEKMIRASSGVLHPESDFEKKPELHLLLTREDVVPILEKHYSHKSGVLDFMGFTTDILDKAEPIIRKEERERIIGYLIRLLEVDKKTALVYAIEKLQLDILKEQALKDKK